MQLLLYLMTMDYGVHEPARLGQTQLRDGRWLGWAEWGPVDGTVVLLCPGAATSRRLGFGGHFIDQAGIRLISVDRPGLGASDPAPDRSVSSWATDIEQLIAHRALSAPMVVGFSQGAPFALALAYHGLVDAVAVVSGSDELAHPRFAHSLTPQVKAMVDAVTADPTTAQASFAGFGVVETFWNLVITTSSAVDHVVYTDPVFVQAFRSAISEALSQGPAGYARDTVLAMSPWGFDPTKITAAVDLWYGHHDTSPVHSPDLGASLTRMIPSARRHIIVDAGGSLLWTHAEAILTTLLNHARKAD
ncbi:MAG: alpha/beta hydrolase [Mycobacteriaceae bacterium]|nr:alpha/beta hydrolase [Mycobacteriaceae bacterium]